MTHDDHGCRNIKAHEVVVPVGVPHNETIKLLRVVIQSTRVLFNGPSLVQSDSALQTRTMNERLTSGIPRLDYILKGGFPSKGIYTIYGAPGTGKTILANQLCFNRVKSTEEHCVYVTLLNESHSKLVEHLSTMSFFEKSRIGNQIHYLSAYGTLKKEGLKGFLPLLQKTILESKSTLLVIDGIDCLETYIDDSFKIREFILQLQSFAYLMNCTTFLLSTSLGHDDLSSDMLLVDGLLEIREQMVGPRAVRELIVHKLRGSGYLSGSHEVEITSAGIQIHPRTEIQFDEPPGFAQEKRTRMKFGIPHLDEMLGGGIPSGSSLGLLGSTGTGKTLLGLKFLEEGCEKGCKSLYFGFFEPPPRLIQKAQSIGINLDEHIENDRLELVWQPPLERYLDSLAEQILEKVRKEKGSGMRLFIDGLSGFRSACIYPERLPRFLSAFMNQLRVNDITTILSEELPLFDHASANPTCLEHVVESILLLKTIERDDHMLRKLAIMKMQESAFDSAIREFSITTSGFEIRGQYPQLQDHLQSKEAH